MRGLRAAIVAVLAVACASGSSASATTPKVAYFYGDSLTYEATPTLAARFVKGWTGVYRTYPGQALCASRAQLETDLATAHPARVTIQSHGGTVGSCLTDAEKVPGSPAHYARFRSDLTAMFAAAVASGARVTYVVTPPEYAPAAQSIENGLTAIAVEEASTAGVRVAYGPRNAVGGLRWRATMRCKTTETAEMGCTDGQIVVRAPDRIHFCPTGYAMGGCPVYASGAFRFGAAIAAATKAR